MAAESPATGGLLLDDSSAGPECVSNCRQAHYRHKYTPLSTGWKSNSNMTARERERRGDGGDGNKKCTVETRGQQAAHRQQRAQGRSLQRSPHSAGEQCEVVVQ